MTVNRNLAETTGLHLPDNAYPLIIGLFRDNVWLGKNQTSDKIQYTGWIEYPWETYEYVHNNTELRQMQYQKLKDLMDAGDDTGYDFIRNAAVYQQHWIGIRYGMGGTPNFPKMFYDVEDARSKYTKCDAALATHGLKYVVDPSEMHVELEPIANFSIQNLTQGIDYEMYELEQRSELIPSALRPSGWRFKRSI